MLAIVDRSKCIGCGTCAQICPRVFEMDDEGLAVAFANPIPTIEEASAQEAADSCPVEAIRIE